MSCGRRDRGVPDHDLIGEERLDHHPDRCATEHRRDLCGGVEPPGVGHVRSEEGSAIRVPHLHGQHPPVAVTGQDRG